MKYEKLETKMNHGGRYVFITTTLILLLLFGGTAFGKPVSIAQSLQAANSFLLREQTSSQITISKDNAGPSARDVALNPDTRAVRQIRDSEGKVLAYVHMLKPEGFIITSADDRIRPIIGYSFKGGFPFIDSKDNVLLHLVEWDMQARLNSLKQDTGKALTASDESINQWNISLSKDSLLVSENDAQEVWGPWINTNWYQSGHYNDFCPLDPKGNRSVVGCVATAMAQIINYWEYPVTIELVESDRYKSKGKNGSFWIPDTSNNLNYPTFSEINNKLQIMTYNNNLQQEGYLSFATGIKLQMNYSSDGSGTKAKVEAYLNGFNYGMARKILPGSGFYEAIKKNMKKNPGWPVQLSIGGGIFGWFNGHSIVVDGYKASGEYHLNFGWSTTEEDIFYFLPDDLPTVPEWENMFNTARYAIVDIAPFKGWNQYGADEKNTFRLIYDAPTENIISHKWYVSPPAHNFKGLVVGTGAKVYAVVSPKNLGKGYHPGLWVINQYGVVEEKHYIDEDENVSYPVQNSKGEVFLATGEGGVYKFDPRAKSMTKIFQEPSGNEFNKPKIDSDDYLYINTDNKLYCIKPEGNYWTFIPPVAGASFNKRIPAIDVSRDNVYIGYYDPVLNRSYLGCVNRQDGTFRYQKTFYDVPNNSEMTGPASISEDGTVYVGCFGKLYALTPKTGYFNERWSPRSFNIKWENAPVINQNGTIYISYWKNVGGTWYYAFGALNPSNGNNNWEITIPSPGDYDNILQPYVASNDVVVFSILREQAGPDTFELYAYQDMGSYPALKWHKDFGIDSGADVAFGPSETIYVLPSSTGTTLYALSEGEVGDPDEAGMAFTNNEAPHQPAGPSPQDGTENLGTSLTLSWTCSDPESHSLKYDVYLVSRAINYVIYC